MEVAPDRAFDVALRDFQEDPYLICPSCGGEIYGGEQVYQWNSDGCDLCEDCFLDKVHRLEPKLLADLFGLKHEEAAFKPK